MRADRIIRLLENFLCAGTSALLVSIAQLYPEFWFVSLLALIPFLWGVIRANLAAAVVLGVMLATCYALVAYPTELWTIPGIFLLKLLALNMIFSLYGILVSRLKKRIGFNAVFIAALWLPLEYALSNYAGLGNLFTLSTTESSLLVRIGSLFGLLMISFVVVLINSLILIMLRHVVQALLSKTPLIFKDERKPYLCFKEILFERRWYYFPCPRAPPSHVIL